ncbi:YifB family Mg chelatase-like AAA ATPase [Oceanomicrobium pacificus]|uniref:YifB family Mg chelatase-like AAA ATPase n=1 Tax=Oceanomicrobium pacificus TaxID=2692916 RepID=A0A6B0TTB0_9RHOB|nr:YifB family Mg chelatase-like AAA ATPase [Oceanomicrobium pacificus]MXU64472.1 YifB family Mg chelatase-like AAA ATPase [Oceanomicrobium pacificus]
MVAAARSVVFDGIDARLIDVECSLTRGLPAFHVVGLPDKAVSEARERVRTALGQLGIAMPAKRVTINLAPADLPKEGAHFDLPIALAILAAMEVIPPELVAETVAMGELALDGRLLPVAGALPAALAAAGEGRSFACPAACGAEAAWIDSTSVIGADSLLALLNHFSGKAPLAPAEPSALADGAELPDLRDVRGQDRAKRVLEIAAAGRHHLLMMGPPGAGKSMLAARLPGLLPPLSAAEMLELSMILSVAGKLPRAGMSRTRPYRAPHHTTSAAALIGGGRKAGPGEISLAHHGVLFLDELPEFGREILDTLRQPLETGQVEVARVAARLRYPCRFLLAAAANPCRCGHLGDPERACSRAPACSEQYLSRISGPLRDRFDLTIDLPALSPDDLVAAAPEGPGSAEVAARVAAARDRQAARFAERSHVRLNADAEGELLSRIADPTEAALHLLRDACARLSLSARGYHRVLRVARTIADLDGAEMVDRAHVAEAISYRSL